MKKTLRVGIAGYGWFGSIHRQAWLEVPGAEVVAIADPSAQALAGGPSAQDAFHQDASTVAQRSSETAKHYPSAEAMFEKAELDLVDIAAPEAHHFALALLCMNRGVPAIVEKPFVLDLAQAAALQTLSIEKKRPIYVGHVLRFDDRYRTVHDRLRTNNASVRHLSLQRHFQRSAHDVYGRTHAYLSALVHDIDLATWLSKSRVRRVTGMTRHFLERPTPDVAIGTLELENGALAVLQNAWHLSSSCPFGFSFDTTVFADGETLTVRNESDVHVWSDEHGVSSPEMHFWPLVGGRRRGALVAELTHFAHCAREGVDSPLMPLSEAVHAIAVAEALEKSARLGTSVDIA